MVVVGSLQPNQPGVLHVDVVVLVVLSSVVVVVEVDSSRHPHHPGVWQVVVLVKVGDVVLALVVVVVSEPLLRKYFHSTQSKHSSSGAQVGTLSYTFNTSDMTFLILWVPIPTRHPLSATVS